MRNLVKLFIFVSTAWIATLTVPAFATDTGANSTGNWNDPTIWTTGLVPGSSDNVYIGSTYPTGAAAAPTVTLTANESASNVSVGYGSPTDGTLNLGGNKLTITNNLTLGNFSGVGTIIDDGGSFSAGNLIMYTSGTSFTFGTSDTTSTIDIENGSALTTAAVGNITAGGSVANGSTLNLGASANFSGGLNVESSGSTTTLNLAGHKLTVGTLYLGDFLSSAVTFERGGTGGTLAVSTLDMGNSQSLSLVSLDRIANFDIEDDSTLTTANTANISGGGSVGTGATLNLGASMSLSGGINVEGSGSTLNLATHSLSANSLDLGYDGSSAVNFTRGSSADLNLNYLYLGNGQNLTLNSGDRLIGPTGGVNIYSGASLTTASTSNINDDTVNVVDGTLSLGANLSIGNQVVNAENGAVLNLNGHTLGASELLMGYTGTSAATLNRGSTPGILSLGNLYLGSGQNLTLLSGDTVFFGNNGVNVSTDAKLTTASSTNITKNNVAVESGGTLNLGASLNVPGYNLNVQDSGSLFNAQGNAVTAAELLFGSNGTAPVTVSNLGAVTASDLFEGNGTSVTLHGGDVISSEIDLQGNSVLTVDQASNGTGLTLNGTSLSDFTLDPSSMDLIFTLIPTGPNDWDFQWADPNSTSNWIGTLTTMIDDHQINLTLPAGQTYDIVDSNGYTSIDAIPALTSSVPLPSSLMLTGLGLATLGAARVRRLWVGVGSRLM